VELILRPEDIELLNRCAPRGAKLDLYILQRRIDSGRWQAPAEPFEPGIWKIKCGDINVVYYYIKEVPPRPPFPAQKCATAYSVSLVHTVTGAGCSAVTEAQALRTARRLRKKWGICSSAA
jgi:hypothetical protein